MGTVHVIMQEIITIQKQGFDNDQDMTKTTKIFYNKMNEIREKIKKTNLKAKREVLLIEKKKLIDEFKYLKYIFEKCELSIRNQLSYLYNKRKDIMDNINC